MSKLTITRVSFPKRERILNFSTVQTKKSDTNNTTITTTSITLGRK